MMAPMTSATPFQIMKSIIVKFEKFEKSTKTSKPADAGLLGSFRGATAELTTAPECTRSARMTEQ